MFSSVQLLSCVPLLLTSWTAACQASLFITNSRSLLRLMSIESVMASKHLTLCCRLLLPPSIFSSIRVSSNESALWIFVSRLWASLIVQWVKNLPAMWATWVPSLGCEDPLKKGKATHSSTLAWRIPWGSQRVTHDWATFTSLLSSSWFHLKLRTDLTNQYVLLMQMFSKLLWWRRNETPTLQSGLNLYIFNTCFLQLLYFISLAQQPTGQAAKH